MTVYMRKPWFEEVLYSVYDTWSEPAGHGSVRLAIKGEYKGLGFFAEYREVQNCPERVEKIIRSAHTKLSQEIYRRVYTASLSQDRNRTDKICRSLMQAFRHGPSELDILRLPVCYDMFGLYRNVYNKNYLLTESLRFSETPGGILVSRIGLKNDIMTLLAPHSTDQLSEENWVIYDRSHKRAVVHPTGRSWFLINHPLESEQESNDQKRNHWLGERIDGGTYEDMWRISCDTIAIRERHNPVCRRTHLPLRFQPYIAESQGQMGQKAQ